MKISILLSSAFLMVSSSAAAVTCDYGCEGVVGSNGQLTCHSLTSFPDHVVPEGYASLCDDTMTILWLWNSGLTELPKGAFDNLPRLQYLHLNSNRIAALPQGIFDNLTNLLGLDLNDNLIDSIPEGLFDKTTKLRKVLLNQNQIREVPVGTFRFLPDVVEVVIEKNRLQSLPMGLFDDLPSLRYLFLGGNEIIYPACFFTKLSNVNMVLDTPLKCPGGTTLVPSVDNVPSHCEESKTSSCGKSSVAYLR